MDLGSAAPMLPNGKPSWPLRGPRLGSVLVEFDRIAVGVLDKNRDLASASLDGHTSPFKLCRELAPVTFKHMDTKVVQASRPRVKSPQSSDEVENVIAVVSDTPGEWELTPCGFGELDALTDRLRRGFLE